MALVIVSGAEAIAAAVELLSEDKPLTEPATSCSIAALLRGKVPVARVNNVVVVLCGTNVDIGRVAQWISRGASAH